MAYEFQLMEERGILVARVGGERSQRVDENVRAALAGWSNVAAELKRRGLHRLLAVVSAVGPPRSLEVSTFFRRLSEMGYMANMRMAVVAHVPKHDRSVLELGIATAQQDGWTIRLFPDEADAMDWLSLPEA